jgi:hypothetical protein
MTEKWQTEKWAQNTSVLFIREIRAIRGQDFFAALLRWFIYLFSLLSARRI